MRFTIAILSGAIALAAIRYSASTVTENHGDSNSNASVSLPGCPKDSTEARVLATLASIAPHSPNGVIFTTNSIAADPIELVAIDLPFPRPPEPTTIPLQPAPSQVAVLPNDARRILETAIDALETKVNVALDNLANAQTPGFKRRRVILAPLAPRHDALAGVQDSAGNLSAVGIAVGQGCQVQCVQTNFSQGPIVSTGRTLDVAIEGDGFFQVQLETGELAYTRVANLNTNPNGQLVIGSASSGYLVQPPLTVPSDALEVAIGPDGIVLVRQPGQTSLSQIGCLQLARFINNDGLRALGGGLYAETDASGPVSLAGPGQQGTGRLRQSALEAANVDAKRELADLQELNAALNVLRSIACTDTPPPSR